MTGIEILATSEVATKTAFSGTAAWICFGIIFGAFILIGLVLSISCSDCSNLLIGSIVGITLGLGCGVAAGFSYGDPTAYETHYKVIISDEVSMNEFLEKYEIIDQEGKIYTIRERNQEDLQ